MNTTACIFLCAALSPLVIRSLILAKSEKRTCVKIIVPIIGFELLAAAEASLLIVFACQLLRGHPALASAFAAAVLLVLHAVVFADWQLQRRLNTRFSLRFLAYLKQVAMFVESSKRMGADLRLLPVGLLLYFGILWASLYAAMIHWGIPNAGLLEFAVFAAVFGLGFTGYLILPRHICVQSLNLLHFRRAEWLARKPSDLPDETQEIIDSFIGREEAEFASPEQPLLRRTISSAGERHFELNLRAGDRPDVIFLFLESFCAEPIGSIDEQTGASPGFDALAREGILFRQFYGNGVQTARAVMSSLFGIPSRLTELSEQANPRKAPRLRGIPHFFEELGYRNGYYHPSNLDFEAQDTFFPQQRFHEMHGWHEIWKSYPEAPEVGWGLSDEFLMRYFVDCFAQNRAANQRTCSTLFTITNHDPFEVPPGFEPPEFHYPGNPEKEIFLRTFSYTDHCLKLLVDLLRERGLMENTLLFVLADTSQPLGRHDNWTEQQHFFEDNLRIPLLILGPSFIRQPLAIDEPSSQLDVLPTILDIFGAPFQNHALGSSLARVRPDRRIYCNNPFGSKYISERIGRLKMTHEILSNRTTLYDLIEDPLERQDISSKHKAIVDSWRHRLLKTNEMLMHLSEKNRYC